MVCPSSRRAQLIGAPLIPNLKVGVNEKLSFLKTDKYEMFGSLLTFLGNTQNTQATHS